MASRVSRPQVICTPCVDLNSGRRRWPPPHSCSTSAVEVASRRHAYGIRCSIESTQTRRDRQSRLCRARGGSAACCVVATARARQGLRTIGDDLLQSTTSQMLPFAKMTHRCHGLSGSAEPDPGARQQHSSQRQHGFGRSFQLPRLLHGDPSGARARRYTGKVGDVRVWRRQPFTSAPGSPCTANASRRWSSSPSSRRPRTLTEPGPPWTAS